MQIISKNSLTHGSYKLFYDNLNLQPYLNELIPDMPKNQEKNNLLNYPANIKVQLEIEKFKFNIIQKLSEIHRQQINNEPLPKEKKERKSDEFKAQRVVEVPSRPITIAEWLPSQVSKQDGVEEAALVELRKSIAFLFELDDELITLLLENSAIDILLSGLTVSLSSTVIDLDKTIFGQFSKKHNSVSVYNHHWNDFAGTIIHELTHAVCFYMFVIDKLNRNLQPKNILNFLKQAETVAELPLPVGVDDLFNAAYLKFKKCVRDDLGISIAGSVGKQFFNAIQQTYNPDMQSRHSLREVFSFYVELRVSLLRSHSKQDVDRLLRTQLPRLHDYFELDIKKQLYSRIVGHEEEFKKYNLISSFDLGSTNIKSSLFR